MVLTLTLPLRLRYRLAWDHDLCRAVIGIFVRAVFATLRRRAAWQGPGGGRSGAVTILQRFGGALNLFHPVGDITALDLAETLQDAQVGIARLVER